MRLICRGIPALVLGLSLAAQGTVAAQATQVIERGQRVYAAQKCNACHAVAGRGNAQGPLDGVGTKLTVEELREWMVDPVAMMAKTKSTRRPPMPSYKRLSPEDLDAVVAYMQSLRKTP